MRLIDADDFKSYLMASANFAEKKATTELVSDTLKWVAKEIDKANTVEQEGHWRSAKNEPPVKDGMYFALYDFWGWKCAATREFKDGVWTEEERRGKVKFWMPIPVVQEEANTK